MSTSWLAPEVARQRTIASRDAYVRATGGRLYVDPIEWSLDRSPESKSWPALIHGTFRGPVHRYAAYPHYVAPEDAMLTSAHRQEIFNRVFLMVLGLLAAILGWIVGGGTMFARVSGLAWWIFAWTIAIEGTSSGRSVLLGATIPAVVTWLLFRIRRSVDGAVCQRVSGAWTVEP